MDSSYHLDAIPTHGDLTNNLTRNLTSDFTAAGDDWAPPLKSFLDSAQIVISWAMVGMGFAGIVCNLLTLLVYVQLGCEETINISYLALSVSDLCCVVSAMLRGVSNTFLVDYLLSSYHIKTDRTQIAALIGGWPNLVFSRTTALITAWISLERCLCVVFPTRVKVMVTLPVTKAVMALIGLAGCSPVILIYAGHKFIWQFDPRDNFTNLLVSYNKNSPTSFVSHFVYGVVYPISSWVTVTICTAILIVKLRASARFRQTNASAGLKPDSSSTGTITQGQASAKETRITKTVILVAGIFILCSLPLSVQLLVVLMVKEYSLRGSLRHVVTAVYALSTFLGQFNSSVNIVIFASLGKKFRSVLFKMVTGRCRAPNK